MDLPTRSCRNLSLILLLLLTTPALLPVTLLLFAAPAGAGCTINDLWDMRFDKQVLRTQTRPLAAGDVTVNQAVAFLAVQLSAGLAVLLSLPHTWYCFCWGAASLPLVAVYPATKRFFSWPQLVLGLTFNWGAFMGWAAVCGDMNWHVILPLYGSGVTWTLGEKKEIVCHFSSCCKISPLKMSASLFSSNNTLLARLDYLTFPSFVILLCSIIKKKVYDTIYAHQDKGDDATLGLQSTALTFGSDPIVQKRILYGLAALTYGQWLTVGYQMTTMMTTTINDEAAAAATVFAVVPYCAGISAAYGHLLWQIQTTDFDNPTNLATRFRSNSTVGALVFGSIVAGQSFAA